MNYMPGIRWTTVLSTVFVVLCAIALAVLLGIHFWPRFFPPLPKINKIAITFDPPGKITEAQVLDAIPIKVGDRFKESELFNDEMKGRIQSAIHGLYKTGETPPSVNVVKVATTENVGLTVAAEDDTELPGLNVKIVIVGEPSKGAVGRPDNDGRETAEEPNGDEEFDDKKKVLRIGMQEIVNTGRKSRAVIDQDNVPVAKAFLLRDESGDRVLQTLHFADLVALYDLEMQAITGEIPDSLKQNRDETYASYVESLNTHFTNVKESSAYWQAYVNWYHLLALHHGPGKNRWAENGKAHAHLDKLVVASSQWGHQHPNGEKHVDGSILTAGLFAVLSLDASQSNDPGTGADIGEIIGSSRFHDLGTKTTERPLCILLQTLCSLTKQMYGENEVPTETLGFKYAIGNGQLDSDHPHLVGGKALYFLARAVLERETVFAPTSTQRTTEQLKTLRKEARKKMQPHFKSAYAVINRTRGTGKPFGELNSHYQACYVARALALLIRNENSHGNIDASKSCIGWAKELIERLEDMESYAIGRDHSRYYVPLAKSCLLRELQGDIRRLTPRSKPTAEAVDRTEKSP